MYLNPLTQFVRSLVGGQRPWYRRVRRPLSDRQRRGRVCSTGSIISTPAELLEARALLAGPQLVSVVPNTGGFIYNGTPQDVFQEEAPKELVLKFSPGASVLDTATNLSRISVTRAGTDGVLGTPDDQGVAFGFVGVAQDGLLSNEVTLRFAETLPDDLYRLNIAGTLQTSGGAFNDGVAQNVDFEVDYGTQVVALVPQPVLRTQNLEVQNFLGLTHLDTFSITAGGAPVTFQFRNLGLPGGVAPGNIAINYVGTDMGPQLATKIAAAVNSAASGLNGIVSASAGGSIVSLQGTAFSPTVSINTAQSNVLRLSDGGLVQQQNVIVAYFNDNPLNPTLAQDPGFYQVVDTSDGSILLPQSVRYSSVSNTAVLTFAQDLPQGTYQLKIGAPNLSQNITSLAVNIGTLFQNTGGYTTNGFLGNVGQTSTGLSDVDLYRFRTLAATTVIINASDIDPNLSGNVALRLFNDAGTPIANLSVNPNEFVANLPAGGTFYVGVSAVGNSAYNPVTGTGAVNGNGFGRYRLAIAVGNALAPNNNTTSFGTSSNLGTLGTSGQTINDVIAPLGNLAYPGLPGSNDEPGHRELPIDENNGAGIGVAPSIPTAIPTYFYNFQSIYGQDPQGNTLFNAITENQKQRAREILDMYSRYLGVEFVETANSGLTIVTGDVRAVSPGIPPDSVGGISEGSMFGRAIMNAGINYGASEYGGTWFNIAFHEIGHSLGLEHSYDAPSVLGSGVGGQVEQVYPGDINLVPAMRINTPESTDINIYRFDVTEAGSFSAETIAQRRKDINGNDHPSLLDSVITLYKETYLAAQVASDFGTNGAVSLSFSSKLQGVEGNGTQIIVQKQALGAGAPPSISVNLGLKQITVTLNSTSGSQTTAQALVDAINNHGSASTLVEARVVSGAAGANIAAPSINYSPLTLTGGEAVRTIVARNDDYFGRDSFISLKLDVGAYYVAVSSTGNTSFDPTVPDTGFGGRTDGDYQLKLNFTPDPLPSTTLNDTNGIALDGDGNAATGGIFNFWFKVADTVFVDKANFADVTQDGSAAHPFSTISAALAAAAPGSIVRIVGNGGTDGQASTLGDNLPYLLGFDSNGNAAADGDTFKIPKDVTVMIDAGAILKLRSAIIDVGASVVDVDRSGSALQVLGTPGRNVLFTSLRNNAIGGNTDPNNFDGPVAGNWGGIVFRQPSDVRATDYKGNGIFLNSVNQANMTFGGGQVFEDSVLQVFNPIHLINPDELSPFFARPAIWNNVITQSADAAISADPNSFRNTADRVGPDIHGNRVTQNTVNGVFIRIKTQLGEPIDKLEVPARIDDTDITYVLTENLLIQGTPGGPLQPNPFDSTHSGWQARVAGSLVLDPGVILKISGARIEAQIGGSQLIAEGSEQRKIIFTSLNDDRYGGGGGTFDTGGDGATVAAAGDYAGLFFNSTSSGSIDRAVMKYAGGTAEVASVSVAFNPIQIQQAQVRVTNTLFQDNANGDAGGNNRGGLLPNGPATIFVRGAQPVIARNTFVDNGGSVVSVNVNSLNSNQIADWGRSTGLVDTFSQFVNNHGPLVRLNRFKGNDINGMEVRGETLTTESTWDDADIVHVVRSEIRDTINLHTYGGLRLLSNPDESLVIKLSGPSAGFTINGIPLDINDRIGGTLLAIGTPGRPVVMTSLTDDTVSAGFDPAGQPQFDTNNDGIGTETEIAFPPSTGPLAITTTNNAQTLLTAMVVKALPAGVTLSNPVFTGTATSAGTYTNGESVPLGIFPRGALLTTGNAQLPTSNTSTGWSGTMNTSGDARLDALITDTGFTTEETSTLTFRINVTPGSGIRSGSFKFVFGSDEYSEFVDSEFNDVVGAFINGGAETNFLRDSEGNLISINSALFNVDNESSATRNIEYDGLTVALVASFPLQDGVNTLTIAIGDVSDPILDSGIFLTDLRFSTDNVGPGGVVTAPGAGDWNGIVLDRYSNDRNVAAIVESEQITNQQDTNGTPATAQFLGNLAPNTASDNPNNHKAGNDDQPLGFEVQGFLNKRTDADVYSFNAVAGTEVWFDISRTSSSLNTVLELVTATGQVLAGSDDSQNDATLVSTASATARSLIKDPMLGGDFYTTNPRDAGFRVILPGTAGVVGTYFIRVRSQNAQTQGEYRLQVRLQQEYEHPGSTIRHSDIRFAKVGIEVRGLPGHTPLGGETSSAGGNNSFATAQPLGNLTTADLNTISVSGSLATSSQVDWYRFQLNYDLIQSIGGVNGADKTWATIFDIDYADGLARADTTLSVYDETGRLILISRDSNVNDDQPGALQGNGLTDLTRGSVGKLDPFIGSVQMPIGPPGASSGPENGNPGSGPGQVGTPKTYYVAISSNTWLPQALNANYVSGALNQLIRLEPVNSVQRIVEDHIGFSGYSSGSVLTGSLPVNPTTDSILPIATAADLRLSVQPYRLSDVVLYLNRQGDNRLLTQDPFNGTAETDVGQTDDPVFFPVSDIKIRNDGTMWGYTGDYLTPQGHVGRLVRLDPATGAVLQVVGNDAIPEFNANDINSLSGNDVDALMWIRNGVNDYQLWYAVRDTAGVYNSGVGASRLYRANPANGAAVVANTPFRTYGEIVSTAPGTPDTVIGFTTGMVEINGTVYGVSTGGQFFTINLGSGRATIIKDLSTQGLFFTGLTRGPQNVAGGLQFQDGFYRDMLFAMTNTGAMVALDTSGNLQPVFAGGASSIQTGQGGIRGMTFSPLDFNLFHPTMQRSAEAGHGINSAFDNSRPAQGDFRITINGRDSTEGQGGASFYFGLENWVQNPDTNHYFTYGPNAQYGILTTQHHQDLTSNTAQSGIGNNYNLPGGAYGSLVTRSFDLTGITTVQKPSLYFNYFLDTENANSLTEMRDSARVFISSDGGASWEALATNNSVRSTALDGAELPQYATASADENVQDPNQQVQELFDNSGTWRQARVDLGAYAGLSDLILRFDFSTAGAIIRDNAAQGLPGDDTGVGPQDNRRGRNNTGIGFYIDDIMIGLAGRGEMVTGAQPNQTAFFQPNPGIETDPFVPKQDLTGPYQLEIRRGEEYAFNVNGTSSTIAIFQQFDVSDRLANGFSIHAPSGAQLVDGQTFFITDGVQSATFEFDSNNSLNNAAHRRVAFSAGNTQTAVAIAIRDAVNLAASSGLFKVTATLGDGLSLGSNSTNTRVDLYSAVNVTSVTDSPDLTVSFANVSVGENGGQVTGTITRQAVNGAFPALSVTLEVINPATGLPSPDATVSPNPVVIPAGSASTTFTVTGVDNAVFNGTRTILVRPIALGYTSIGGPLDVTDNEVPSLTVQALDDEVLEDDTGTVRVTRNTPTALPLVVSLASLNLSELTVPATVTIPAGATFVDFTFTTLQDGVLDGDKVVGIVAYASSFAAGSDTVTVEDSGTTTKVPEPGANVNISRLALNQSNGQIVIDRTNSNRLFVVSNSGNPAPPDATGIRGLIFSTSVNSGVTWTVPSPLADGGDAFPVASGSPSVATDEFGNLFIAYLNRTQVDDDPGVPNQVIVLRSSDFGQTFSLLASFPALNPDPLLGGVGQPRLAAGNGAVWLAYRDIGLTKIRVTGAQVSGLGSIGPFNVPIALNGSDTGDFADIDIGPNGEVMVAFQSPSTGSGSSSILVSVDPDGLLGPAPFSFNPSFVTSTGVGGNTVIPAQFVGINASVNIAWDRTGGPNDGRVYLVYTDRVSPTNTDVYLRFSDDNGATWSTRRRVNDDTGVNGQFLPQIAIDQDPGPTQGNVIITWFDARNDLGQGGAGDTDGNPNNDVQLWGAIGVSDALGNFVVGPNAKISTGTINGNSSSNGNIALGDYMGLDFDDGAIYPLWSDNSTALGNNPDLPGFRRLDLATSRVTVGAAVVPPLVIVDIPVTSVTENGGVVNATLSRTSADISQQLIVQLTTNTPGIANVPLVLAIPAGQASRTFTITGINNPFASGSQTLVVTPTAAGHQGVGDFVNVTDDEQPQLTLDITTTFAFEGTDIIGTVTRNTPITSPLTVNLLSTDPSELLVPATITIPVGQASANFVIKVVNDNLLDGTVTARIIATVPGMASGRDSVQVFDAGNGTVESYNRLGDRNTPRKQGALQIYGNTIRNTQDTAIRIVSGARDNNASLPHPGSVQNGPTLNNERQVPGPQISNNLIYNFGTAGIQFSGDSNPSGVGRAASPYGRIVNNTIFGGLTAQGTGILVANNAAPTILNNIVSNTTLGVSVDASSTSSPTVTRTVIDTTLFKGNSVNGVLGTNSIQLNAANPLFVDPSRQNFYLAGGTASNPNRAVDSSRNVLQDRAGIIAVKSPLGIPQSPVTAPLFDLVGQLRLDDPNTANATGLGLDIFKDRGAIERADFVGPTARLVVPLDNQAGVDGDPTVGRVFIISPAPLTQIDVELNDVGIGIDISTANVASAYVLRQDGVVLVEGVDYIFSFNPNTRRAAFLSISVFPSDSDYSINVDTSKIKDLAGNPLQGNQADGSALFEIIGNAPPSLTQIATLSGLRNVNRTITYAELLGASDLDVVETHTALFRIETVPNGTLTIVKNGSVTSDPVVPGVTLFAPGDVLTWEPPNDTIGVIPAFTVVGYDPENAVIAPALTLSSPPISVNVNLVNLAPDLTTIDPLDGADEDLFFTISYAALVAASDLNDQNGDSPLFFLIQTVADSSTLEINDNGSGFAAVDPGTTLFGPGDLLRWKAPLNQNNELNGGNPLDAFSVVATDSVDVSSLVVPVRINVDPIADAPLLSTLTTFGLGGLNSPFRIRHSDLLANSNAANVDGHPIQFRVESITVGTTLQIRKSGSSSAVPVVVGTDTAIVSPGDSLFWTPALGVSGNNLPAFTLVGYDDFNNTNFPAFAVSTPAVQARVNVLNVPSPTMTSIAGFTRPRFVPASLTFADIQAAANETISNVANLAFRVDALSSGSLTFRRNGVTNPVVVGQTLIIAGDTLIWTPPPGATGPQSPFTLLAVDQVNQLASLDAVPVSIDLVNVAPTLTSVTPFAGANQATPFNISYTQLLGAANEQDANNDVVRFRITSVDDGTLQITKSGTSTAVAVSPGVTLVEPGDVLTYTPSASSAGNVAAFKVVAFDGLLSSSPAVQVAVQVIAFGANFNIGGPWVVGGQLARINQSGPNLTLLDQNGQGSNGGYTGFNTITGRGGLIGTIDTTTADNGRILWSDGVIWIRLSLGGQYYNPANNLLTSVTQNDLQLTVTNAGGLSVTGTITGPNGVAVPAWGHANSTWVDGVLRFSGSDSNKWVKLDLSPSYTTAVGGFPVGVRQDGTTNLVFVNRFGDTSAGRWTSPTTVLATDWNSTGVVMNGRINWNNGASIWNKNLVVFGQSSGQGQISIAQTNSQMILTNKVGGTSVAKITGPNTIVAVDWGNAVGVRNNGKILWQSGGVWDNFDFNALDAVFSDIKTLPFPS